jgi:hypothetical protein
VCVCIFVIKTLQRSCSHLRKVILDKLFLITESLHVGLCIVLYFFMVVYCMFLNNLYVVKYHGIVGLHVYNMYAILKFSNSLVLYLRLYPQIWISETTFIELNILGT